MELLQAIVRLASRPHHPAAFGLAAVLLTLSILGVLSPAQAATAKIADLNVTQLNEEFTIKAHCEGAFTKYVNNAMLSEIPIILTIHVNVIEKRRGRDLTIFEEQYAHSVEYKGITSQYTATVRRGKKDVTFLETRFPVVRDKMSEIHTVATIPREKFNPESTYVCNVKVTLDPQKIPPMVEFLNFFLNPIDTPWKSSIIEPVFRRIDSLQ